MKKSNTMEELTHVIIADDHALFADGLEEIVQTMKGFVVIGKVIDGKQLMQMLNHVIPDMILMDINMPYLNGVEAAQNILKACPQVKIIFVSMYVNAQLIVQAKEIGAKGYVLKDVTASVLKDVIQKVKQGTSAFQAGEGLQHTKMEVQGNQFNQLSPRELDIIALIKSGMATKQIAAELELSIFTVETHRKNIHRKLKVQSAAELIALIHTWNF